MQSEASQNDIPQYSIVTYIYGIQNDGNDNSVFMTEKEARMHKTDFWTPGEKARV